MLAGLFSVLFEIVPSLDVILNSRIRIRDVPTLKRTHLLSFSSCTFCFVAPLEALVSCSSAVLAIAFRVKYASRHWQEARNEPIATEMSHLEPIVSQYLPVDSAAR